MIKSLNLAYTFPYPSHNGYDLRVWNMMRQLGNRMDQTLICRSFDELQSDNLFRLNEANIRVYNYSFPKPSSFYKIYRGISFLLKGKPILSAGWYFPSIATLLDKMIREERFDLVVMEGSWLAPYWPIVSRSRSAKVIILHNLEEEWLRRNARITPLSINKCLYIHDAYKMAKVEGSLVDQADLVVVMSERDKQALLKKGVATPIAVAPNGVDCENIIPLPPSNTHELLFVGSMSNLPNRDGVLHFSKTVLPRLCEEFPDLVFRVVGKGPPAEILKLNGKHGIAVMGEVDDLEGFYRRSAISVVPLRSGGGTRLKIFESMAYGRPVVSTSIGCEGVEAEHNKSIMIADDPQDMAESIGALLKNKEMASHIARNARTLVEQKYSWAHIARKMFFEYVHLLRNRGCSIPRSLSCV